MSDPITAAIAWIGAEIGGEVGAAMIMYAGEIATATMIVSSVAIGANQQARARRRARDAYNASLTDRLITTRTAVAPSRVVLGRCRVGGSVAFIASTGENSSRLAMVIALAGHEIDAVETVYFNDAPVTLDANGWVTTQKWCKYDKGKASVMFSTDMNGNATVALPQDPSVELLGLQLTAYIETQPYAATVSGSTATITGAPPFSQGVLHYQTDDFAPRARVLVHTGAPGQVADSELTSLFPDAWGSGNRGDGIAYLVVLLDFDTDVFHTGIPNVSAVVRGAKCFDPRTSTTAWTENPALLLRYYAASPLGGRMTAQQITASDAQFIAAANVCDTSVTWNVRGNAVSGPLYTAGLMATTDQRPWDVMQDIAEAMAGKLAFVGNKLLCRAGSYVAPVLTLGDDDFAGGSISIQPRLPREQLFNVITGKFSDAEHAYQVVDMPRVDASAYITEDGAELVTDVEYAAVTGAARVQQLAAVALRELRQGMTVVATFKLKAYAVELFDTVSVTCSRYGWTAKVFQVLGKRWTLTGGIELTLRETAASVYTMGQSFDAVDAAPNTQLPTLWNVPAVGPLTVTSSGETQTDRSVVTRTRVTWPALTDASVLQSGSVEIQYARVQGADTALVWQSVVETGTATETVITGLLGGAHYLFAARATNGVARGPWSVMAAHQVVDAQTVWENVEGRPRLFRVSAVGFSATGSGVVAGLFDAETGGMIASAARSYNMARIRRSDGAVVFSATYDVYVQGGAALASALDATGSDHLVVIWTYDEPQVNRLGQGLAAAMYRCGASRAIFGNGAAFKARSAYVLIGIAGVGEGGGAEFYGGSSNSAVDAWCDASFYLQAGQPVVSGTAATVRLIETQTLAPAAATDVRWLKDETSHASGSTGLNALSVTLSETADIVVTAQVRFTATVSSGVDTVFWSSAYIALNGTQNALGSDVAHVVSSGSTYSESVVLRATYAAKPAGTYSVTINTQKWFPLFGNGFTINWIETLVEVIKR